MLDQLLANFLFTLVIIRNPGGHEKNSLLIYSMDHLTCSYVVCESRGR